MAIGVISNGTTFVQEIRLTISSENKELLEDLRAYAYGDLDAMLRAGVFSFKNGHAEIHRDNNGKLSGIKIIQWTYRK